MNQSGSAKETVSPKFGENIEILVCFICVGHKTGFWLILLSFVIIYSSFSADKLKYIIHIIQKILNNIIAKTKG